MAPSSPRSYIRDLKYVEIAGQEREKAEILEGDLLFNRTNSKELVGKTGLWDGRFEAVAASYFIRLRVKHDQCTPTYLWAFNTQFMKRYGEIWQPLFDRFLDARPPDRDHPHHAGTTARHALECDQVYIRVLIEDLRAEWRARDERIAVFAKEFVPRNEEPVRRLVTIPGIGTINATALVATVSNARAFRRGRDMAAWLGLAPRQMTTGGKPRLLGISKYLIHGARAVLPETGYVEADWPEPDEKA